MSAQHWRNRAETHTPSPEWRWQLPITGLQFAAAPTTLLSRKGLFCPPWFPHTILLCAHAHMRTHTHCWPFIWDMCPLYSWPKLLWNWRKSSAMPTLLKHHVCKVFVVEERADRASVHSHAVGQWSVTVSAGPLLLRARLASSFPSSA